MGNIIRETEHVILVNVQYTNKPVAIANIPYMFVFQWIGGAIDTYIYPTEREFKQKMEEFHLYESPSEASGRIVYASNKRLLDRVRGYVE